MAKKETKKIEDTAEETKLTKKESKKEKELKKEVEKETKKVEKKSEKNTEKEEVKENKTALILSPRLTEKASNLSSGNVYTFNVKDSATKITLAKEIQKVYKVKPLKITIINHPREATFFRNNLGYKSGFKKALVTLKKGDKIDLA